MSSDYSAQITVVSLWDVVEDDGNNIEHLQTDSGLLVFSTSVFSALQCQRTIESSKQTCVAVF